MSLDFQGDSIYAVIRKYLAGVKDVSGEGLDAEYKWADLPIEIEAYRLDKEGKSEMAKECFTMAEAKDHALTSAIAKIGTLVEYFER